MPIRSRINQYHGLNAHLQSYLLNEPGGWHSFHNHHIAHLCDLLDTQLPNNYYALAEQSLQISEHDLVLGAGKPHTTIPDVAVYATRRAPGRKPQQSPSATPTMTVPLTETFLPVEEDVLSSVVIYEVMAGAAGDRPVTRIELLSASNKPPSFAYPHYLDKRQQSLESGLCVVELDYLHEQRSPLLKLPSYPGGDPGSFPYLIIVNDPWPSTQAGETYLYGFRVDDPVPVVAFPLADEDTLAFDFGSAYNITFSRNRYYGLHAVDYAELPVNFDAYQPDDQARIQAVMQRVKAAVDAGDDLSQGPPSSK